MDKFLEYLQDEDIFVKPVTLLGGIAAILGLAAAIDGIIKELLVAGAKKRLFIYTSLVLIWTCFWLYKRYVLPRTSKGKIGIILALATESNKEKIRVKNDLVRRMQELIDANQLDNLLDIVLLTNHQAERVNQVLSKYRAQLSKSFERNDPIGPELMKQRIKLQKRLRGIFYVWGSVVVREGDTTYLENDVIVFHCQIDPKARQQIAVDMTSIWSPQFTFKEKAEYRGFRLSAELISLAALYIIGEAAFVVNQFDVALRLHESLDRELGLLQGHPNLRIIKQRLNELLAEEYNIVAYLNHSRNGEFDEAKRLIELCLQHDPRYYDAYIQKARIEFEHENNPGRALQTIRDAMKVAGSDGTWRYSEAFLLMYMENFRRALTVYKQIAAYSYEGEKGVLEQIYEFNHKRIEVEPEKLQPWFIIGFLKYKKSRNYPEALEYLERFLQLAGGNPKYNVLVNEAARLKSQLENIMELNK